MANASLQTFLLLQGPVSPFFRRLASRLEASGHRVIRVNLSLGDWLFWRRPGAVNYRGALHEWPQFVADLMDREKVTDLVLLGEQRPYHKIAAAAAEQRGVRITVTDFGYLRPDWLTFERDGQSGRSRFPRRPEAIRALAAMMPEPVMSRRFGDSFFRQAAYDLIYQLASTVVRLPFAHYQSHHVNNPVLVHLTTGWRQLQGGVKARQARRALATTRAAGEPYWLLPMQMELDYSIRAYSRYEGMEAPLREVIASFARGAPVDGRLFIKLHPLDPGLRNWGRLIAEAAREWGIEGRVTFIDGGDLLDQIAGAQGVVTVNSTVGMLALQRRTPTIALGEAIYDVEGLTFRGPLDRFWTAAVPPDPALLEAFLRAAAGAVHIRGVFYSEPGLSAAVEAAARRLEASEAEAMAARIAAAEAVVPGEPQTRLSLRAS